MISINFRHYLSVIKNLLLCLVVVAVLAPTVSLGAQANQTLISSVKVVINGLAQVTNQGKDLEVNVTVTNTGNTSITDATTTAEVLYSKLIDTTQPGASKMMGMLLSSGQKYVYVPEIIATHQNSTALNLVANESKSLSISFPAPTVFGPDNNAVKVSIYSQSGGILGQSSTGLANEPSTTNSLLSISPDSLSLAALDGKKLLLTGESSIDPGSVINVGLTATNNDQSATVARLQVVTYKKSPYFFKSEVATTVSNPVNLNPKTANTFSLSVKAPKEPQSYAVTAQLINKDNQPISSLQTAYFSVKGAVASFGNLATSTHLEWYGKPQLVGSVSIIGSADQKTPFSGTLQITAHTANSSEILAQQNIPISVSSGSSFKLIAFQIPYSKYFNTDDLLVDAKLISANGQQVDSASSRAVHSTVPLSAHSKKIIATLVGLLVVCVLPFIILKVRSRKFNRGANTVLVVMLVLTTALQTVMPKKVSADEFTYDHPTNGETITQFAQSELGIGISNKTMGKGTSVDPYTSYIGSDTGGIAVSSIVVAPSYGPSEGAYKGLGGNCAVTELLLSYCQALVTSGSFTQTVYNLDPITFTSVPNSGLNQSTYFGTTYVYLDKVKDVRQSWTDGTGTLNEDSYIGTYLPYNRSDHTKYTLTAPYKPSFVSGYPASFADGHNLDAPWGLYRVAYGTTSHDGVSRTFQYPSATFTINNQSDLVPCSTISAFNNMGGASGIGDIVSSPGDKIYLKQLGYPQSLVSPEKPINPKYFSAIERNKHGDFILSVYACVGLHPGSTVGKVQISFKAADNIFYYQDDNSNHGKYDERGFYYDQIYSWSGYDDSTSHPQNNDYYPWDSAFYGGKLAYEYQGDWNHDSIKNRTWWPLYPGMTRANGFPGGLADSHAGNTDGWDLGAGPGQSNVPNAYSTCSEFTVFGDGINQNAATGGNSGGSGAVPPSQNTIPPTPDGLANAANGSKSYKSLQHSCPPITYPQSNGPTLSGSLTANPTSTQIASPVDLLAQRDSSSTATGPITYTFVCDTTNSSNSTVSSSPNASCSYSTIGNKSASVLISQGGKTATYTSLITITAASVDPVVNLIAPAAVYINNPAPLSWTNNSSATYVTLSGGEFNGSTKHYPVNSGTTTQPLTVDTTYLATPFTAAGVAGAVAKKTVQVVANNLVPPPQLDLTGPNGVQSAGTKFPLALSVKNYSSAKSSYITVSPGGRLSDCNWTTGTGGSCKDMQNPTTSTPYIYIGYACDALNYCLASNSLTVTVAAGSGVGDIFGYNLISSRASIPSSGGQYVLTASPNSGSPTADSISFQCSSLDSSHPVSLSAGSGIASYTCTAPANYDATPPDITATATARKLGSTPSVPSVNVKYAPVEQTLPTSVSTATSHFCLGD